MSVLASLTGLLTAPMPGWVLILVLAAAMLSHGWQHAATRRRLDSHARSIGHMDRWASMVDERLEELAAEDGVVSPFTRSAVRGLRTDRRELAVGEQRGHGLSTDQVKRLVGRISRAHAA